MTSRSNKSILLINAIVIVLTILSFILLIQDRDVINYISLGFLIFSEIVVGSSLIYINTIKQGQNKPFSTSGITLISFIYFVTTFISVLFTENFNDNVRTFIWMQMGIIAIFAILIIVIINFSKSIHEKDKNIVDSRKHMSECEIKLNKLLTNPLNKEYENELNEVYEKIRYSDKIGNTSVDKEIISNIEILEKTLNSDSKDNVKEIIEKITHFVTLRREEIQQQKRGSF